jgi:hypothetical protein
MKYRHLLLPAILLTIICSCEKKSIGPTPVKKWSIAGRIFRINSSIPIANVRVTFAGDSILTDTTGSYQFDNIAEGRYLLTACSREFWIYRDSIFLNHNLTYDIPLLDSANVVGRVTHKTGDSAGFPVVGAVVAAGDIRDTTNNDGYYALVSVPYGEIIITCKHPDCYPYQDTISVSIYQTKFDMAVESKYNVVGRVSHRIDGPIKGAVVSIDTVQDTTDENGYYRLPLAPIGDQTIICNHPDYYPYQDTIFVSGSPKNYDIIMESKYNIIGQVSHRIDGPIEGAVVSIDMIQDMTDNNGYYALPLVPVGDRIIICNHPDYYPYQDTITVSNVQQTFNIIMGSKINLIGTVSHRTFGLLDGAEVTVAGLADTTDDSGYFQLALVPLGSHDILCRCSGYADFIDTIEVTAAQKAINIIMKKEYEDTLYISEDATVKFSTVDADLAGQNFGQDNTLNVSIDLWMETREICPGIIWSYEQEADAWTFLRLPVFNIDVLSTDIKEANLVLTPLSIYGYFPEPESLLIFDVMEDWSEENIKWSEMPSYSYSGDVIYTDPESLSKMEFNLLTHYRQHSRYENGLLIKTGSQFYLMGGAFYIFASSEYSDSTKRPYVVITYLY